MLSERLLRLCSMQLNLSRSAHVAIDLTNSKNFLVLFTFTLVSITVVVFTTITNVARSPFPRVGMDWYN